MLSKVTFIIGSFFIFAYLTNPNSHDNIANRLLPHKYHTSIQKDYSTNLHSHSISSAFDNSIIQQSYSNTESESKIIFKEPLESVQKKLFNWIFILNAVLGLIISLRIAFKYLKKDSNNIFFGIFLAGVSLMLIELTFFWGEDINYNPKISFFRAQFYFWVPSLFLYLKNKIKNSAKTTRAEIVLHYFTPILVLSLYIINLIINEKLLIDILNNLTLKSIHLGIYLLLIIYSGIKYKDHIHTINKKFLIFLILFIVLIFILLITRTFSRSNQTINSLTIYLAAIFFSIFIEIISAIILLKPDIILIMQIKKNNIKEKYKNSGLTNDMLLNLKEQLQSLLITEKVYLDNNLTLEGLSTKLNTDRYSLSQTINQEFGKNYYELINDYRVQEAIRIIHSTKSQVMITDLIYESGFNNKVSFYKAFKKRHNSTPLEYQKRVK